MNRPLFSLLYTSVRPTEMERVVDLWLGRYGLDQSTVEVILCVDHLHVGAVQAANSLAASGKVKLVLNTAEPNCVNGWNTAARQSHGHMLITLSDDFVPPERWGPALLSTLPQNWMDQEWVVAVRDGVNPDIFTISILTRARYEKFGYVFYPAYQSMFCDTEFSAVAMADGVVVDARHLLFEHHHPSAGMRRSDAADALHSGQARWNRGETLFNFRRGIGFPMDRTPWVVSWEDKLQYAAFVLATKDDFCLEEVCNRLVTERPDSGDRVTKIFFFVPTKYWSGAIVPDEEHDQVAEIARRVGGQHGVEVEVVRPDLDTISSWQKTRIMVETDVRNWCVRYIRDHGFNHILVLDGDELWRPGLLGELGEFIRDQNPTSVYTGMVPVAGLPGYPVEGALDKATIYLRADTRLQECRGAWGCRRELQGYKIYHFTATRRTMAEIVAKHRNSGHADDPAYAMEAWITDTLLAGRIKPGARDVHMWKAGPNVWPLARAWTAEELAELPASVRPYLG